MRHHLCPFVIGHTITTVVSYFGVSFTGIVGSLSRLRSKANHKLLEFVDVLEQSFLSGIALAVCDQHKIPSLLSEEIPRRVNTFPIWEELKDWVRFQLHLIALPPFKWYFPLDARGFCV